MKPCRPVAKRNSNCSKSFYVRAPQCSHASTTAAMNLGRGRSKGNGGDSGAHVCAAGIGGGRIHCTCLHCRSADSTMMPSQLPALSTVGADPNPQRLDQSGRNPCVDFGIILAPFGSTGAPAHSSKPDAVKFSRQPASSDSSGTHPLMGQGQALDTPSYLRQVVPMRADSADVERRPACESSGGESVYHRRSDQLRATPSSSCSRIVTNTDHHFVSYGTCAPQTAPLAPTNGGGRSSRGQQVFVGNYYYGDASSSVQYYAGSVDLMPNHRNIATSEASPKFRNASASSLPPSSSMALTAHTLGYSPPHQVASQRIEILHHSQPPFSSATRSDMDSAPSIDGNGLTKCWVCPKVLLSQRY